jgi:hypothetical protein
LYEGKSKSKGNLKKKHNYSKYTEMKLILLFKAVPLDFNAQIPEFHNIFFLIPSKKSFLVASLANFALRQFLERIITADENWAHHYEQKSRAQSMTRKHPTSSVAKKFKIQPSAGKIMLTLFWDMEGEISVHFTAKGENVNSQISLCLAQ